MIDHQTIKEIAELTHHIDAGNIDYAKSEAFRILAIISQSNNQDRVFYLSLSNIAAILIDAGNLQGDSKASTIAQNILEEHKTGILRFDDNDTYYYNLGNAKSNLLHDEGLFDLSFHSIEQLMEAKSCYWKAIEQANRTHGTAPAEYLVNLGNALKRQFRIVEALACYDEAINRNLDIPQAWLNRSDALMLLNMVSSTYSIEMLVQIKNGYEETLKSKNTSPSIYKHIIDCIIFHLNKINETRSEGGFQDEESNHLLTRMEFDSLTDYRKFCLTNRLSLSEHGLYCPCIGSARDDLTIPTASGVAGHFIIPMELVLNRLKSEFSFARHLYYEYLTQQMPDEFFHESCFSELLNDEVLGIEVEKLRTAFRMCFGILDKIAVAVCELYDVQPPNGQVYFQNFWQLSSGNRRAKFESIKNPGLLALYSIATDLNERRGGELSFYKQWRNDLEHKFVVVHTGENPNDIYDSFNLIKDIVFIKEDDFIEHLKRLLQITRSAIFSFAFCVRDKGLQEKDTSELLVTSQIFRQDRCNT